ncbi:MAG: type VI secretion system tube protein Hcp [Rubrivivax sp.]|nr:type VI secretion system tube protein Hcp [Rubrivivax sp.]
MPQATALQADLGIDAFLSLTTKRAGKAKGEATAVGHAGDITVVGWRWGMNASSALGSTQATTRRSYSALTIVKRVDQATTAILSAAATNDEVKEAKLTLRRAGGSQVDFLTVTVSAGRIVSVEHESDPDGGTRETLGIAFTKVQVEYAPQQASGSRGGTAVFNDELPTNT